MDFNEKEAADFLRSKGYGIIPPDQYKVDMEEGFLKIWSRVKNYTMTSIERGYALYCAVNYIVRNDIEGDFVECGVWKGGSCMLIALSLLDAGISDRVLHLYDTFEGMTEPGNNDYIAWNGRSVQERWEDDKAGRTDNFSAWAVGLKEVKKNIGKTGYPDDNIRYIKGPVEKTLEDYVPEKISLLRLDTDWYESTKAELEHMYPLLSHKGVLILDDYGHFTGARKAVDEYFNAAESTVLLNRIDYTGRISIKF